jgi:hypothetical protein
MSRTTKDMPYRVWKEGKSAWQLRHPTTKGGAWSGRWYVSNYYHSRDRRATRDALRKGEEPPPLTPRTVAYDLW